jgi:hypothetical protein
MDLKGTEARDDCAGETSSNLPDRPKVGDYFFPELLSFFLFPSFLPSLALLRGRRDQSKAVLDRLAEFNTPTVD